VADTVNDRVASIPFAWMRRTPVGHGGVTVTAGGSLNSPLGMALAPTGDVIAVRAIAPGGRGVIFVDDGDNTLKRFHESTPRRGRHHRSTGQLSMSSGGATGAEAVC
jgi:hypothetical protein